MSYPFNNFYELITFQGKKRRSKVALLVDDEKITYGDILEKGGGGFNGFDHAPFFTCVRTAQDGKAAAFITSAVRFSPYRAVLSGDFNYRKCE